MTRPYRLDLRLAIVVTAMSALTLLAAGAVLTLEFTRGQFAIEERGLASQAREWAPLVQRGPDGRVAFVRPPEPSFDVDPPYTGLLVGDRPVYGYVVVDSEGRILDRSPTRAPAGRPGPARPDPVLSSGPALDGSGPLLVAETHVPEAGAWFRLARARSDVSALANTFFAESLAELGWAALGMSLVVVVTAVIIVRMSLGGLRRVASQAQRITFETLEHERLAGEHAPAEVQPLIAAVNQALDSVEVGAAAQRDFSIHAAHELRTPLADLKLRLESMAPGPDREAATRDVDAMARLIEQLLQLARLDGGASVSPVPLDLSEVTAQLLGELAPRLVSEGWSLTAEGLDEPATILGDPTLIALILRNLLENVRRHTPVGTGVEVRVSSDGSLLFQDNGPGLPSEMPDARTTRFIRGHDDLRSGSGLGLAICQSAMRRMGGEFRPLAVAEGASFLLTFATPKSLPSSRAMSRRVGRRPLSTTA